MPTKNTIYCWDRLYDLGAIQPEDFEIYQIPEFARLNRVSLSALPTWSQPAGMCASRAEHSRGVRHLAKLSVKKSEFRDSAINIIFAATLHDIGAPPFPHLSEHFQRAVLNKDHEQFCEDIILNSRLAEIIKKQDGDPETVIGLIKGENKPLSDLINGTIDLDNLDNTLRFGLSMGIIHKKNYDPEKIALSFTLWNGQLALQENVKNEVDGWDDCRREVYKFVYGNENLCSAAMLGRALSFACLNGELTPKYFTLTDDQATEFVFESTGEKTKKLFELALHWRYYPLVVDLDYEMDGAPEGVKSLAQDWKGRQYLSDKLAEEFSLLPEQICAFVSRDKGVRKIHLPFIGDGDKQFNHTPNREPRFVVKIYVAPEVVSKVENNIQQIVEKILQGSAITGLEEKYKIPD